MQADKVKYKYFRHLHMWKNLMICLFLLVYVLSIMVVGNNSLFKRPRKAKPILVKTPTKRIAVDTNFICRVCFSGLCHEARDLPYKCKKILNSRYLLFKEDFHKKIGTAFPSSSVLLKHVALIPCFSKSLRWESNKEFSRQIKAK